MLVSTVALAPMLPVPAGVSVGSYEGLWITLVQVLIGLALGFCVQLVFSAVSGAAETGRAVKLSNKACTSTRWPSPAMNAVTAVRLRKRPSSMLLSVCVGSSNEAKPRPICTDITSPAPLGNPGWQTLAGGGTIVFALALRIALPIIAIMMIVNLGFAVLSRTAQALNPFAVGIAATLVVGLMLVMVMMTSLAPVVERSVMDALDLGGRAFSQFSTLPR